MCIKSAVAGAVTAAKAFKVLSMCKCIEAMSFVLQGSNGLFLGLTLARE